MSHTYWSGADGVMEEQEIVRAPVNKPLCLAGLLAFANERIGRRERSTVWQRCSTVAGGYWSLGLLCFASKQCITNVMLASVERYAKTMTKKEKHPLYHCFEMVMTTVMANC